MLQVQAERLLRSGISKQQDLDTIPYGKAATSVKVQMRVHRGELGQEKSELNLVQLVNLYLDR
jgi:hypothetical protein